MFESSTDFHARIAELIAEMDQEVLQSRVHQDRARALGKQIRKELDERDALGKVAAND
ncbi:hypothetical protein RYA99_12460 [Pseudomonas syringae pv. actinidifoliorum]|nr:hypothetical protein [Pseudomonas syringae pv. actinidifoliorum]MDU8520036.1 hypothetical protein [Pseudomonas syringae pv. actinidifoliorum]MDU8526987.1 hypothetical protein [Pseudomonas syringae pv. actinidifoliorum]